MTRSDAIYTHSRQLLVILRHMRNGRVRSTKQRLIGLAVVHGDFAYFGRILEGIAGYAEHRRGWNFVPVVFERRTLYTLGPRKPDGLLVSVNNRAVAQALRRWTRPVVDTALILPGLGYPSVRVDNRQVAQLAFSHLC